MVLDVTMAAVVTALVSFLAKEAARSALPLPDLSGFDPAIVTRVRAGLAIAVFVFSTLYAQPFRDATMRMFGVLERVQAQQAADRDQLAATLDAQ